MDLLYTATSSGTVNFVAGELPLKKNKRIFQLLSTGVFVGLFFGGLSQPQWFSEEAVWDTPLRITPWNYDFGVCLLDSGGHWGLNNTCVLARDGVCHLLRWVLKQNLNTAESRITLGGKCDAALYPMGAFQELSALQNPTLNFGCSAHLAFSACTIIFLRVDFKYYGNVEINFYFLNFILYT